MPVAPRQGRKGGKISASPALAMSSAATPSSLSPGTLPPSILAGLALPPDVAAAMQASGGGGSCSGGGGGSSGGGGGGSATAGDGGSHTHSSVGGVAAPLFDWQVLLDDKRFALVAGHGGAGDNRTMSASVAGAAATAATAAAGATTTTAAPPPPTTTNATTTTTTTTTTTSSSFDGSVLKFDLAAISQVGQGVVIGGSKTVRVVHTRPSANADVVRDKLHTVLTRQQQLQQQLGDEDEEKDEEKEDDEQRMQQQQQQRRRRRQCALPVPHAWLAAVHAHDVTLTRHAPLTLRLTAALATGVAGACVLVVLPHYHHVADVARRLRLLCARQLRAAARYSNGSGGDEDGDGDDDDDDDDERRRCSEAAAAVLVGEMSGSAYVGAASCRVWVTCAATAFCLYGQPTLPPFTHVVFTGLTRTTPLLACFLLALRERLHRWNSTHEETPAQLRWLVCPDDGNVHAMRDFFSAGARVCVLDATQPAQTLPSTANDDDNNSHGNRNIDTDSCGGGDVQQR